MKIAIHYNKKVFNHSGNWSHEWIRLCNSKEWDYDIVNCFDDTFLDLAQQYDILLWHFDDKIAEYYLLKSVDAPIPRTYVYYTHEDSKSFINKHEGYPLVAKLKSGSGSNNVRLLRNKKESLGMRKKCLVKDYRLIKV